ncbi:MULTISPECIES: hypothetical protein [Hydrocarboniphaga]|uniref:Minor tail T domain-containing protein n=1 Tax=Hydrocarboniphaga effusa AP103 TaxID=1172194 RepID=I7ZE72_9GAMM|nr:MULTISPECIES: hypothetical protein [Hydrocarboniphaga]EIT70007.1 hypothetical protein WQQ_01440 [Hydrocarboniphaga effusa AP103]EIT70194.1 hypothetical protein WQQ_03310 [Hydrocarboniphaga effusa AP103]MDZ4077176.1 hypothetical protein [Hydrocarboniphaga sp.]
MAYEDRVRRALSLRWGCSLRYLSRVKLSYAEFLYWARHFAEEPFDDRRCFDRPAAEIRHLYVNSRRKEGTPMIPLEQFMPYRDREPETAAIVNIDHQVLALL